MIGKTLGHYQITEKLGEGGMGVVYKARDTHLDRFVAIKVLPAEKVADADRKRRFVQEAKAASALNHPNIITIHDITKEGGTDFIVMEYVAGRTLNDLIPRKGIRLSLALKYAVQIADALARAHGAGIIHRDLKPSNVMVNERGLVKVLDFGLAKLTEAAGPEAETVATGTGEGALIGTPAYMSPEQAEGKRIDTRSDIFSFGSMLYEMLTGQRAFRGDTKASTVASILREEPKPVSQVAEGVPRDAEKIVRRCLRKDPEQRFQTMADLRVALQELKEDPDSGARDTEVGAKTKPRQTLIWAFGAVAALVIAAVGVWFVTSRNETPEAPLLTVPLTSYPGYEDNPSFSPDGNFVAFQWCGEAPGANCDIWIKQIGVEPPVQLTHGSAMNFSPAFSPDGLFIAFLHQLSPTKSAVTIVPRTGGQERVLGQCDATQEDRVTFGPVLAWAPDSKWLVIPSKKEGEVGLSLLSVETLQEKRLTAFPGDRSPAFSPDGRTIAFVRGDSDIHLLRLGAGYEPQEDKKVAASTQEPCVISAIDWTPSGDDIVFCRGNWTSTWGLWRVATSGSGKPRTLGIGSEGAPASLAVSRKGNRLAYRALAPKGTIWGVHLDAAGQAVAPPFQLIRSTRDQTGQTYSPDGNRVAFTSFVSGHGEIWECNSDGANPVRLTSFGRDPKWSPDGRSIAFHAPGVGVYVISANGGSPRLAVEQREEVPWHSWSHDGNSIYFRSNRSGESQIWKIPARGGQAVQITRNGGDIPRESPDGKFLYYMRGYPGQCSIWRMPTDGEGETMVLDAISCIEYSVGKQGIYFFTRPDAQGRSSVNLHEFRTGKARKLLTTGREPLSMTVSPDGRTILYTQNDQGGSDLMLVENFR